MVNLSKLTRRRLGEILVDEGLVTEDQVQEALHHQQKEGKLLGEVLVDLGYVSEMDIAKTMVKQFGFPFLDASHYKISEELREFFSSEELFKQQMVPLDKIGRTITVAVAGLPREEIFTEIETRTGCEVFLYASTASQVLEAIRIHYDGKKK